MKTTNKILHGIALALTCSLSATIKAQNLFVSNFGSGTIGEYGLDGSTVNASLISGLNSPSGIAISGNDLFVANSVSGTVSEYTTSGATVNDSLIGGLSQPSCLAMGPVPEPSAGVLTGLAVATLWLWRRRNSSTFIGVSSENCLQRNLQ